MPAIYIDSSALVKRYVREAGSPWVSSLFTPARRDEIFTAAITPVEVIAAIARRVRTATILPADAALAFAYVRADVSTDYQVVGLAGSLLVRAMDVGERHGLRGYDAIQLAAALEVNEQAIARGQPSLTFVAADVQLNETAAIEGLRVDNPTLHL